MVWAITGEHHLTDVYLERPYTASDRASTGLRSIWSEVELTSVQLIGWYHGMVLEQDACYSQNLHISGGRDGGNSVLIDGVRSKRLLFTRKMRIMESRF